MPNVPNVPGVPTLPSYAAGIANLLVTDLVTLLGGLFAPQWGLFQNGAPVVIADTVVSFDFRQDYDVADYQQENGAFQSYNKVGFPFDVKLRFAAGGSEEARQDLLDSVAAIIGSTQLFDAVTPEQVYQSVNPVHFDYTRTADRGVGMISIDVWCKQIRVSGTQAFTNTAAPSGAATESGGNVQTQPTTPAQQQELTGADSPLRIRVP